MAKTLEEIANIAAKWWGDKVCNPKFDNGDKSGGMAGMLASMLAKPIDYIVRDKFVKELSRIILSTMDNRSENYTHFIDVDYGPCSDLSTAAKLSGLPENNFPWKTSMHIGRNFVSVRYGYEAEEEYLYVTKDFWRGVIKYNEEYLEEVKAGKGYDWVKDEAEKQRRILSGVADLTKKLEIYRSNLEKAED